METPFVDISSLAGEVKTFLQNTHNTPDAFANNIHDLPPADRAYVAAIGEAITR